MSNEIKRKNWRANFTLVGEARVNDYTYKLNEQSTRSNWIYNSLNLGIDCGEKYGTIYTNLMGGYATDRDNFLYVINKDENGNPDYEGGQAQIHWDDRKKPDVLKEIADSQFITVGLEKKTDGKTFYEKFLSPYDAIEYISEHLTDGMVVRVRGNIKYSMYQGRTQIQKNITSIALSTLTPDKYSATFKQSVLIDSDSANLSDFDEDKEVLAADDEREADVDEDMPGEFTELPTPEVPVDELPFDEEPAVTEEGDVWDDEAVATQTSPTEEPDEEEIADMEQQLNEEPATVAEEETAAVVEQEDDDENPFEI